MTDVPHMLILCGIFRSLLLRLIVPCSELSLLYVWWFESFHIFSSLLFHAYWSSDWTRIFCLLSSAFIHLPSLNFFLLEIIFYSCYCFDRQCHAKEEWSWCSSRSLIWLHAAIDWFCASWVAAGWGSMQEADGHGDCQVRPLQQPLLPQSTAPHGAAALADWSPLGAIPGTVWINTARSLVSYPQHIFS